ncbi:lysozyme, partial [Anabrus simplex]|uniref:lysozyme n=1 Tax=Anabrus simplex TaxID=316456 RepID=UPI0035A277C2
CDAFVPNLHQACLRCLCKASSGCNLNQGCDGGYCGPFSISRIYWADAGRPVLPDDDPDRRESFQDCARVYGCAKRVVKAYMAKYAKDCNGDGSINCDDYAMIHHNGGFSCGNPLSANFARVYYGCRPPLTEEEAFLLSNSG